MLSKKIDFQSLLAALIDAGVEFIVVGGVAAGIHGVIVSTGDLDVVYSRDPKNLERLESVLILLDGSYLMNPNAKVLASRFDGPGHHNLSTKYGRLDLLGSAVGGVGYPELIDNTMTVDLGAGRSVPVLDLPTLIHIKEQLHEDKDKLHLLMLKRLQAEKDKK